MSQNSSGTHRPGAEILLAEDTGTLMLLVGGPRAVIPLAGSLGGVMPLAKG